MDADSWFVVMLRLGAISRRVTGAERRDLTSSEPKLPTTL